jgi:hypothetical protein
LLPLNSQTTVSVRTGHDAERIEFDVGMANSLKWPSVVTRPAVVGDGLGEPERPSGPVVIPCGLLSFVGGANSVKVWLASVLIRPILLGLLACSVSDSTTPRRPVRP